MFASVGRGVICQRSAEDTALPGSVWRSHYNGIAASRAASSSKDSLLCPFFSRFLISVPHSVFTKQCCIPSSVSPCAKWSIRAWATAHLGRRKREVLLVVCSRRCVFNGALHLVNPKSSPGVLPMQGHRCLFIWWPDKFRSRPAGDPTCLWILQSTMFNACSC